MTTKDLLQESCIPIIEYDEDSHPESYLTASKVSGLFMGFPQEITLRRRIILDDITEEAVFTLKEVHKFDQFGEVKEITERVPFKLTKRK